MNYYFITGTSKGLGKAFVEHLLQESPENFVYGFSRTNISTHANYTHMQLDLSNLEKVKAYEFPQLKEAKKIILINNAGTIGMVKPIGKMSNDAIIEVYNVNLITPVLLANKFMKQYETTMAEKRIINVSSGAGKNPVASWGAYCSAKSGVDMLSRVMAVEQKIAGNNVKVYSIAPGVVDTEMQTEIRKVAKEDFPRLEDFINYKETNQLAEPKQVAAKYFRILDKVKDSEDVVFSVKDFD